MTESLDKQFKDLKLAKQNIKSKLTRFKTFLASLDDDSTRIDQLTHRFRDIETALDVFSGIILQLQALDENTDYETEMINFEETFYEAMPKANSFKQDDIESTSNSLGSQQSVHTHEVNKSLRILRTFNQPVDSWDCIIIYLLTTKLDAATRHKWESQNVGRDMPDIKYFLKFLDHRRTSQNKKLNCLYCKENHLIYYCTKFLQQPVKNRIDTIKKLNRCLNCLKASHDTKTCPSGVCKYCSQKHNSLLHLGNRHSTSSSQPNDSSNRAKNTVSNQAVQESDIEASEVPPQSQSNGISLDSTNSQHNEVLLSTALIYIADANGINQGITTIEHTTKANIQSKLNRFNVNLSFLVINSLSEKLPVNSINSKNIKIPANITLADPYFNVPNKIDILLGAPIFYNLLCIGQVKITHNEPTFPKTKLGWPNKSQENCNFVSSLCLFSTIHIQEQLQKFWELEDCGKHRKLTKEEEECEEEFVNFVETDKNGRFMVPLLLKDNVHELGESLDTALKRFTALESNFQSNQDLKNHLCEKTHPVASQVIRRDFYVDDLITGASSTQEARQLKQDLQFVLEQHGFNLRKWLSNDENVINNDQSQNPNQTLHTLSDNTPNKTLGLYWNAKEDTLQYSVSNKNSSTAHATTDRRILSTISQIFDPLGLAGPIIITAKIILQKLWKLNLDWGDPRNKWKTQGKHTFAPGQLVLLKEDNQPPLEWRLGRIIQEFPGSDGVTRVVLVHTNFGDFKRSVHKLCPLHID
nr:unnamed protein product [Callosobruchus analis]